MPHIEPFKGIFYNQEKIKDLRAVLTPPYDVITPVEQDRFYALHEYNMIRLDLGKELPEDSETNNRYTRASEYFTKWLSEDVLVEDERPSIYFYELLYSLPDEAEKVMKGFIALCKLERFGEGKVFPHEYTLSKPKTDRLNLLRSCQANFSLIFSLYSAPPNSITGIIEDRIRNTPPRIDIMDENKVRHRLWVISDRETIEMVQKEMENNRVYIADGHHRYEASLKYRDEQREELSGTENTLRPYDFVMMYFANMNEPGLTILPTHRVLYNIPSSILDNFERQLERYFHERHFTFSSGRESVARKELYNAMKKAQKGEHLIGMYIKGKTHYTILSLRSEAFLDRLNLSRSLAWRRLDVSILQGLILEDILGLQEESLKKQENLIYVKDMDDAINKVNSGDFQVAFLLSPPGIEEIEEVISNGERMPQKSTYFFPKFKTGTVIYKF